VLLAFNQWFGSRPGVWQTLLVVGTFVVLERLFPRIDPSMFALMAWLTIYSAVTQPALALAGRLSAERLERLIELVAGMQRDNAVLRAAVHALTEKHAREHGADCAQQQTINSVPDRCGRKAAATTPANTVQGDTAA
jgi:hypothetical protein